MARALENPEKEIFIPLSNRPFVNIKLQTLQSELSVVSGHSFLNNTSFSLCSISGIFLLYSTTLSWLVWWRIWSLFWEHWVWDEIHPEWEVSSSQSSVHTHIHWMILRWGQSAIDIQPTAMFLKSQRIREKSQTVIQAQDLNQEFWSCEATTLCYGKNLFHNRVTLSTYKRSCFPIRKK